MPSVKEVWQELIKDFKKQSFSSPPREARLLLSSVLEVEPSRLYLFWDEEFPEEKSARLEALLKERLRGVPLQYLAEKWDFFSLTFRLKRGVFIPRLDTEAWVEEAITYLRSLPEEQITVCDMCCGSGVIGLNCAFWVDNLYLYGADISPQAVELSQENARLLGLDKKSTFLLSDLFSAFPPLQFDVILSNPPYIKNRDWDSLPPEIRLYEPREALLAGEEGLDIIERILKEGEPFLKEGGLFFLEHDPEEREAIQKLADTLSLEYLRSIPDLTGNERASVIRKRRSNNENTHR